MHLNFFLDTSAHSFFTQNEIKNHFMVIPIIVIKLLKQKSKVGHILSPPSTESVS